MNTSDLLRDVDARSFDADALIFQEGQPGAEMFFVREGEVEIMVHGRSVEVAGPGSIVGEMALIDTAPRSATVLARTACQLVPVDRQRFLALVQEAPDFALSVMKVLADRLRAMDDRA